MSTKHLIRPACKAPALPMMKFSPVLLFLHDFGSLDISGVSTDRGLGRYSHWVGLHKKEVNSKYLITQKSFGLQQLETPTLRL